MRRDIHDIHDVMFSLIDRLIQNIWQPLLVARKSVRPVFSKQRPPENILNCQYRRGNTSKWIKTSFISLRPKRGLGPNLRTFSQFHFRFRPCSSAFRQKVKEIFKVMTVNATLFTVFVLNIKAKFLFYKLLESLPVLD